MVMDTDRNYLFDTERFSHALSLYEEMRAKTERGSEYPGSAENADKAPSIGVLGEKSLHAFLKLYYEPDPGRHEIKVGNHVADIVGEDGIMEIQTRHLSALKPKLNDFLGTCRVTVVHPVIASKRVISVNGDTGEVISVRKSPKHGTVYSQMREIYSLRELLTHENFTLRLPLLTADEYRTFGVRTNRRKKQRTRSGEYVSDMIPTGIIDEITLAESSDYTILLPEGLPREFTVREFAAAASTDEQSARMAVNLLIRTDLVVPRKRENSRAGIFSVSDANC